LQPSPICASIQLRYRSIAEGVTGVMVTAGASVGAGGRVEEAWVLGDYAPVATLGEIAERW
jgi:hypothetical protein